MYFFLNSITISTQTYFIGKKVGVSSSPHGYVCANFRIFTICGFCSYVQVLFFRDFNPIFIISCKNFSKNIRVNIILVLDAAFVPNLTFLGLLRPEILFGEKSVTLDTQLISPPINLSNAHSYHEMLFFSERLWL